MKLLFVVSVFYLLFSSDTFATQTQQSVALIIGNSEYKHAPTLANPSNDASDLAETLSRLGFQVTLLLNQKDAHLREAIREFSKKSRKADLALVYFAGHGIEIDKSNYLIPIDAEFRSETDAQFEAVQLGSLINAVSSERGVTLVLVDACRNNPFADRLIAEGTSRSIGTGLVRVNPAGGVLPGGVLISYAAREGEYALDGDGRNSPYAQGLLEHLEEPGLEIGKLFRKVRDRVFVLTEGQQEPFTYGSLPSDDIFLKPQIGPETLSSVEHKLLQDFVAAEREDTVGSWDKFLSNYSRSSDNELVAIAKRRLDVLRGLPFARQKSLNRELWLVPEAGTIASGSIELNLEERKLIQRSLNYLGHQVGNIDGVFGTKTGRAISAARLELGLISGIHVDLDLIRALPNVLAIDALRSENARNFADEPVSGLHEPRLERALRGLGNRRAIFDYFEGRLYFAVLGSAHDFGLARGNALARGMGGHLATISNRREDKFVFDLFGSSPDFSKPEYAEQNWGIMMGLYRPTENSGKLGNWTWVTGEPLTYTNWSRGHPDMQSSTHFVALYYARWGATQQQRPAWRDTRGSTNRFVIEIE